MIIAGFFICSQSLFYNQGNLRCKLRIDNGSKLVFHLEVTHNFPAGKNLLKLLKILLFKR